MILRTSRVLPLVLRALVLAAVAGWAAEPTPAAAQSGYSIAFVRPLEGQTVSGTVVVESKPAWPSTTSLDRVQFFVDEVWVDTEYTAPFCMNTNDGACVAAWDTRKLADGRHTLRTKLITRDGQQANASVAVTVRNGTSGTP